MNVIFCLLFACHSLHGALKLRSSKSEDKKLAMCKGGGFHSTLSTHSLPLSLSLSHPFSWFFFLAPCNTFSVCVQCTSKTKWNHFIIAHMQCAIFSILKLSNFLLLFHPNRIASVCNNASILFFYIYYSCSVRFS